MQSTRNTFVYTNDRNESIIFQKSSLKITKKGFKNELNKPKKNN